MEKEIKMPKKKELNKFITEGSRDKVWDFVFSAIKHLREREKLEGIETKIDTVESSAAQTEPEEIGDIVQ